MIHTRIISFYIKTHIFILSADFHYFEIHNEQILNFLIVHYFFL